MEFVQYQFSLVLGRLPHRITPAEKISGRAVFAYIQCKRSTSFRTRRGIPLYNTYVLSIKARYNETFVWTHGSVWGGVGQFGPPPRYLPRGTIAGGAQSGYPSRVPGKRQAEQAPIWLQVG